MANIKSAKKQAKQSEARRVINLARKTAVKTSSKKVLTALAENNGVAAQELLKQAEAQLSRAKSKGVIHKRAASRKISRLAKKVSAANRKK